MEIDKLDETVIAIGKNRGTVKLSIVESIPVVTVVEGDDIDTWHVCVNHPYRGMQFGKQANELDAIKQLRKVKQHYEKLARQVQREIDWITGEPNE